MVESSSVNDFQQQISKLERELELKMIAEDKKERALLGEVLFKDAKEDFEMVVLKLQKVIGEIDELVKEQNNIWFQLHAMKKRWYAQGGLLV